MEKMRLLAIASRPGVPAAREALRGHQRLGQAQQLVHLGRQDATCSTRARRPMDNLQLPRVPHGRHPGGRRLPGAAAHVGGLGRQRPPPGRRTRPRRPSSPSSWATSWAPSWTRSSTATPTRSADKVAMDLGVAVLPNFLKDNTDRNRTSPFAFTGNKFEFRMPGSNVNLSDCNMILNTAMAKSLKGFADAMEGKAGEEFEAAAIAYIKRNPGRAPAHHLQRQRLFRRMAGRGGAPGPGQPPHHRRRAAVPRGARRASRCSRSSACSPSPRCAAATR